MLKLGIIRKYRSFMPAIDEENIVTLGEGDTPLIQAETLKTLLRTLGAPKGLRVYLKFEGVNPTGSFKDRGMTMAISKAKEKGVKKVICASTGNTSSSAAAYAKRAGMECEVYLPKGKVAAGKVAQTILYGANLVEVEGNFDDALAAVRKVVEKNPEIELVNSSNPFRLQGQKTAAFEICDDLDGKPDYHFIPVGNAGNITAYWMGYKEYLLSDNRLPRMMGFQAEGAAPLVLGHTVENPETVATAIRIGNPVHRENALKAAQESGGAIYSVTDEEILEAYRFLALEEQVFCEPASAASVAGLLKLVRNKLVSFKEYETIVCTLTGNGLKDPGTAEKVIRSLV